MNKKLKKVSHKHRKKRAKAKTKTKELKAKALEQIEEENAAKDSVKMTGTNKDEEKA